MEPQEDIYDRIERYLQEAMDPDERSAFEAELARDPDAKALALRAELDLHRDVMFVATDEPALEFHQLVGEVLAEKQGNTGKAGRTMAFRSMWWVGAAAGIGLLMLVGVLFLSQGKADHQELFASNFEVYEAPAALRSDSDGRTLQVKVAFENYSDANFSKAYDQFDALLLDEPENVSYLFYRAMSALADDRAKLAVTEFRSLADRPNIYRSQSQWYLALAYLHLERTNAARAELEAIASQPGRYSEPARELLSELD